MRARGNVAIVYMGNYCGGLCGFGTHHVLQKKDGKWTEIQGKLLRCFWASKGEKLCRFAEIAVWVIVLFEPSQSETRTATPI
jgi:hypothetical protein